jgi:6-phosphogluconate dehydrogenase
MGETIAILGLGIMGRNLALNFRDHGFHVLGFDPDPAARSAFLAADAGHVFSDVPDMVGATTTPRFVMLMIPAGTCLDDQLAQLMPLLSAGDVVVDGGNSHFRSTEKRQILAAESGLHLVGVGISGGSEGARHGPALMLGGTPEAIALIAPILSRVAACASDGTPCVAVAGPGGAGHFVKMIHNGIEYADMQMIAEAYYLLRYAGGLTPNEIARVFVDWNEGALESYLLRISAEVLAEIDPQSGLPLVDVIVDQADQKGTGQWAASAALEFGVPAPTIAEAVHARCLTALKAQRVLASSERFRNRTQVGRDALVPAIHDALLGGRICAYAQGFSIIAAASRKEGWATNIAALAKSWTGGCIVRARMLAEIGKVFENSPSLENPLLCTSLSRQVFAASEGWRRGVGIAIDLALPVPALSSALAYWDGYGTERLWADLIQGQRERFGSHGFTRTDSPGIHHHTWQRSG